MNTYPWEEEGGGLKHGVLIEIPENLYNALGGENHDVRGAPTNVQAAVGRLLPTGCEVVEVFAWEGRCYLKVWGLTLPAKHEGKRYAEAVLRDGEFVIIKDAE